MPDCDAHLMDFHTFWCLMNPGRCEPLNPETVPEDWKLLEKPPPAAVQQVAVGRAISSVLELVGYVGPDQEGGPDPNGPYGPYIRDALIGLSMVQLASQLSDAGQAQEVRQLAAQLVRDQADRIGSHTESAQSS